MLLTFPTKESLLRNLNEMPVQDVFLIVANHKIFKDWNLIPLKSLTMVLGPNSSGKSIIFEIIEFINNITQVYHRYHNEEDNWKENVCFGFSQPYNIEFPYYADEERFLQRNFIGTSIKTAGVVNFFIIEELQDIRNKTNNNLINKKRYTFLSTAETHTSTYFNFTYSVYLDHTLISKSYIEDYFTNENHSRPPDEDRDISIKTTFSKEANLQILSLPLLERIHNLWNIEEKSVFDRKVFNHYNKISNNSIESLALTSTEGFVKYLPDGFGLNKSFERFPTEILELSAETNYIDIDIPFSLRLATYDYPIAYFRKTLSGIASEDIRNFDSDWKTIVFNNRSSPSNCPYNMVSDYMVEINQWLSKKHFIDSPYYLEKKEFIEIPSECLGVNYYDEPNTEKIKDFLTYSLDLHGRRKVYLKDKRNTSLELSFNQVGTGYSQIIPLLAGLISGRMLVFKQPELHLHPRLQSRVADCFVETVFNERQEKNKRIRIIETHSEHFVLRLLRRLRESKGDELFHSSLTLYKDDVAFIYLQPNDNSSLVHYIPVTQDGEFVDGWPDGFFDERDEDLWGTPSTRGT